MKTYILSTLAFVLLFASPQIWAKPNRESEKKGKMMLELKIAYDKKSVEIGEKLVFTIELTNNTDKPLEIKWQVDKLLEFVKYEYQGPQGNVTVGGIYHSSEIGVEHRTFILAPGKSVSHKDSYAITAAHGVGVHKRKAIFEYRDPDNFSAIPIRLESSVVELEVHPAKRAQN